MSGSGRRVIALSLTMVLLVSLLFFESAAVSAEAPWDGEISSRVDADRALGHVRVLSDQIGPRVGGLESEKKAAKYIASQLRKLGYAVEEQPFSVPDQYIGYVQSGKEKWQVGASPEGRITGKKPVSGDVIDVGKGLSGEDYAAGAKGKMVLIQYDSANRNEQLKRAVENGAKGVLFYNTVGSRGNYGPAFSPRFEEKVDIPVLGISWFHGQWLIERLEKGRVKVKVNTEHHGNLSSLNVIATRPAKTGDPHAPVVMVTAHMDSVVGAPGANDNASGTALTLELARVLRKHGPGVELRFAFFGSEERGLLGSRHYVNQLSDEEAGRIIGVFNADMVATSYENVTHLYAMTVDGEPNRVADAAVEAGERLGKPVALGRFGSSDHVPFHQRGIPAALFIWMRVDSWDPLVYDIEKVYHTPMDTIGENISPERMQTALEVIGSAVSEVIRKPLPLREPLRKAG